MNTKKMLPLFVLVPVVVVLGVALGVLNQTPRKRIPALHCAAWMLTV